MHCGACQLMSQVRAGVAAANGTDLATVFEFLVATSAVAMGPSRPQTLALVAPQHLDHGMGGVRVTRAGAGEVLLHPRLCREGPSAATACRNYGDEARLDMEQAKG